jgi:hypothetical protein
MKRFLAALGASLVALVCAGGLVATAPSASAYPAPVFDISVDHQVMIGGTPFTGFARASVECHDWTLRFLDQTAAGAGKNYQHRFSTPVVTKKTVHQMTATCVYSDVTGGAGRAVHARTLTWTGEIPITLLPQGAGTNGGPSGHDGNGILPGTGGPGWWVLLVALMLLAGGGVAMLRSRRGGRTT